MTAPTPEALRELVRTWRERAEDFRQEANALFDLGGNYSASACVGRADQAIDDARELEALLGEETT